VADYNALVGVRAHYNWQVNAESTKKVGKKVSIGKDGKTREYDREDLIVTAFHGYADLKPAKKTAGKSASRTNGSGKTAKAKQPEVDIEALANDHILAALEAAKGNTLTKGRLSGKLLQSMANVDTDVRAQVREWAMANENLAGMADVTFDPKTETLSLTA
jgi:hypothetical protein